MSDGLEDPGGDRCQRGASGRSALVFAPEEEMKIQIRCRNIAITEALRARVERRLGFALSRFGERIGRVLLQFSDTNGHSGDVDKRCQIDVGLTPKGVQVEHIDADMFVALDRAADRASRAVARALDRERDWDQNRALVAVPPKPTK
ncbi:MAG TPA: ribosome-associated translation inhibitor RaiA [Myxococcales bacterium]